MIFYFQIPTVFPNYLTGSVIFWQTGFWFLHSGQVILADQRTFSHFFAVSYSRKGQLPLQFLFYWNAVCSIIRTTELRTKCRKLSFNFLTKIFSDLENQKVEFANIIKFSVVECSILGYLQINSQKIEIPHQTSNCAAILGIAVSSKNIFQLKSSSPPPTLHVTCFNFARRLSTKLQRSSSTQFFNLSSKSIQNSRKSKYQKNWDLKNSQKI